MNDFFVYGLKLAHELIAGQSGRVIATALVLLAGILLNRLATKILVSKVNNLESIKLRHKLVWAKNVVWATGSFIIIGIWSSSIAGVALSLAAVAGAMLIVSKELITCVLGYIVLTINRPYDVGDFVEIAGHTGKVLDCDVFGTTLAETGSVRQLTGKTVVVPNSVLLTSVVKNGTATGKYIINLYKIVVPFDIDIERAEICALKAAQEVCSSWKLKADEHFVNLEAKKLLDLPSAKEKVLWESFDSKSHGMVIRFACPPDERVSVEQEIFRKFWTEFKSLDSTKKGIANLNKENLSD